MVNKQPKKAFFDVFDIFYYAGVQSSRFQIFDRRNRPFSCYTSKNHPFFGKIRLKKPLFWWFPKIAPNYCCWPQLKIFNRRNHVKTHKIHKSRPFLCDFRLLNAIKCIKPKIKNFLSIFLLLQKYIFKNWGLTTSHNLKNFTSFFYKGSYFDH